MSSGLNYLVGNTGGPAPPPSRTTGTADYSSASSQSLSLANESNGHIDDDGFDDVNITDIYSAKTRTDDSRYFNLGSSSFPLLPHYDTTADDHFADEKRNGADAPSFSLLSQTLHTTHLAHAASSNITSVLNAPTLGIFEDWNVLTEQVAPQFVPPTFDQLSGDTTAKVYSFIESLQPFAATFEHNHSGHAHDVAAASELSDEIVEAELQNCNQTVPPQYFADDFSILSHPFISEPFSASVSSPALRQTEKDMSTMLQSQLSAHLDVVETCLFHQISQRSHLFFNALNTIQSVQQQIAQCATAIQSIRTDIAQLNSSLVATGLSVAHTQRVIDHAQAVMSTLQWMTQITQTQSAVQLLLSTGDYPSAVELILSTRRVLNGELSGVHCLRHVEQKLNEMLKLIDKLVCNEFFAVAIDGEKIVTAEERDRIIILIQCLNAIATLSALCAHYKLALHNTIKQRLLDLLYKLLDAKVDDHDQDDTLTSTTAASHPNDPSSSRSHSPLPNGPAAAQSSADVTNHTTDNAARPAPVASPIPVATAPSTAPIVSVPTTSQRLQSLTHRQFLDILTPLFRTLLEPIHRAFTIRDLVLMTLQHKLAADDDKLSRERAYEALTREWNDLLVSSADVSHTKLSKLLAARANNHVDLPLNDFRELLDVTLAFVNEGESLCGRTLYQLRGVLLAQAKRFVESFHNKSLSELNQTLETERWQKVEGFAYEYQELIDHNFKRTNAHSQSPLNSAPRREDRKVLFVPKRATVSTSSPSPPAASSPSKSQSNYAKFPVVPSVLTLLTLISQYVEIASSLQAVAADVLQRLLELLTLYNSRACQLVLGAGSIHIAGLKSITAKNLALSSQAVALIASQTLTLRQVFSQLLPGKQQSLVNGFDRLQRDCVEHQKEIAVKLIGIMKELTDKMMANMIDNLSADSQQANGSADVDESIRTLMQQTCSLHRALTDLLPTNERDDMFRQIAAHLTQNVTTAVHRITTSALSERNRAVLSANVHHIASRTKALDGIESKYIGALKHIEDQLIDR